MAVYTPVALVPQIALTNAAATYYTATAVTAIARTVQVSTPSAGKTFTLSFATDAAGTRSWEAYALAQNVPSIFNGWWVIVTSAILQASCAATAVSLGVFGYTYA